jgi:hypothetical protein
MKSEAVLTIPVEGMFQVFATRSIEDISGEEFIEWIKFAYPGGLKEEDSDSTLFETLETRMQVFQAILSFWMKWSTPGVEKKEK